MSDISSRKALLDEVREKSKALNPTALLARNFKSIVENSEAGSADLCNDGSCSPTPGTIRVMQWNLLAQGLCQTSDNFVLCPVEALDWQFRQYHILEELLTYRPSVYCLQEVDHFSYLHSTLKPLGYEGIFFPKPDSPCLYQANNNGPDGCAIFWDLTQVSLVSQSTFVLRKDSGSPTNQVAVACKFKQQENSIEFVCATTHLKAKPHHAALRTQQGRDLEKVLREEFGSLPLIICGDFNADPDEECVGMMKKSKLDLVSSYTLLSPTHSEPAFTTCKVRGGRNGHEAAVHTIDYIFYSRDKVKCLRLLDMPTIDSLKPDYLPSFAYPSDHLSLVADFKLEV